MLQMLHTTLIVVGGLIALIAILLALPASRLRDFLNPIIRRGDQASESDGEIIKPLEHLRRRDSANH